MLLTGILILRNALCLTVLNTSNIENLRAVVITDNLLQSYVWIVRILWFSIPRKCDPNSWEVINILGKLSTHTKTIEHKEVKGWFKKNKNILYTCFTYSVGI